MVVPSSGQAGVRGLPALVAFFATVVPLVAAAAPCGQVQVWGSGGTVPKYLEPPAGLDGVKDVKSGKDAIIALKADGTLAAWGDDGGAGVLAAAAKQTGVKQLAYNGGKRAGVVKTDGSVEIFGMCVGDFGACSPPAGLKDVVSLASVNEGTMFAAVTADGKLHAWGWMMGDLNGTGNGETGFVRLAGGHNYLVGVKADGSTVGWSNAPWLVKAPEGGKFKDVTGDGSYGYMVYITPEGKAVAWGGAKFLSGQGDGPVVSTTKANVDHIMALATLANAVLAVRDDGTVVG